MSPRRSALLKLLLLGAALTPWLAQAAAEAASAPPAKSVKPAATADGQILLQADQIIYDGDGQTVSAVGHVEIVDQGRILNADTVTYDQKTDKVTADGHVSVTDAAGQCRFLRSCGAHRSYARRRAVGLRRVDRQEWPVGRCQRRACGRHHGDRAPDRLQPLQDLQPARPTHAGVAGESGASSMTRSSTAFISPMRPWICSACRSSIRPSFRTRSHGEICQRPAGAGFRQLHQDRLFRPHSLLLRNLATNDLTVAPQILHRGRRVGGDRISRPLEQWRHVAARFVAYNPKGGLGGNAGLTGL